MEITEIKKDLFTMPQEYYLAHCISADAKMGAGIAVQFRKRFKLTSLQDRAANHELEVGKCYRVDRVCKNLKICPSRLRYAGCSRGGLHDKAYKA